MEDHTARNIRSPGRDREESTAGTPNSEVVRHADSEMLSVELNISHYTFNILKRENPSRPDAELGFSRSSIALTSYSFRVNQVESDFIPFRSMLFPSHTAKAMGTDMPALNCVSLASPVSNGRFTTTRQVGPE